MTREAMPCRDPIRFLEQKNQNPGQGLEKLNHLERLDRLLRRGMAPQ